MLPDQYRQHVREVVDQFPEFTTSDLIELQELLNVEKQAVDHELIARHATAKRMSLINDLMSRVA